MVQSRLKIEHLGHVRAANPLDLRCPVRESAASEERGQRKNEPTRLLLNCAVPRGSIPSAQIENAVFQIFTYIQAGEVDVIAMLAGSVQRLVQRRQALLTVEDQI